MNSNRHTSESLSAPAFYFPVDAGAYVMKAGLRRLGTAFGNGAADQCIFQFDRDWLRYRRNKMQARVESLPKYYCTAPRFGSGERHAVTRFLLDTLLHEYPTLFRLQFLSKGKRALHCLLSGERLCFEQNLALSETLTESGAGSETQPPYRDSIDALACQIQEDLCVISTAPKGHGRVLLLHLCAPNHWAAAERIDRSFQQAHAPVPKFDRIARHTPALLDYLREAGPYVRFAWGLATDRRLNHHPEPAAGWADPATWHGRRFNRAVPALYLRVERQVLTRIAANDCVLFTIRTYFTDVQELDPKQRSALAHAIGAMDGQIARYKGLLGQQEDLVRWLRGGKESV